MNIAFLKNAFVKIYFFVFFLLKSVILFAQIKKHG